MHLRQSGISYSACQPFTKDKENKQFRETEDSRCIYRKELDKASFPTDMNYGDFQDLLRRTPFNKALRYKAFSIAKNKKTDGYQRGLASEGYNFLDKFSSISVKIEIMPNQELAKELLKKIIGKFEKRNVNKIFKDHNWGTDLADIQLMSKFNGGILFSL